MESGVYMIKNLINNKIYVGSSKNIINRWQTHKYMLKNKKHKNEHLNNAWLKYGENNFVFIVIEYVETNKLIEREQYYIDYYKTYDREFGYNKVPEAGTNLGWIPSTTTKMKMSESAKKRPPISDETRKKLSMARTGNKHACRIVTDEEKKKMSISHKGINQGERNGKSITNKNEIISMRKDYDNGMSVSEIMIKYNKKETFTYQIVKRLRWKWLDESSLCDSV